MRPRRNRIDEHLDETSDGRACDLVRELQVRVEPLPRDRDRDLGGLDDDRAGKVERVTYLLLSAARAASTAKRSSEGASPISRPAPASRTYPSARRETHSPQSCSGAGPSR